MYKTLVSFTALPKGCRTRFSSQVSMRWRPCSKLWKGPLAWKCQARTTYQRLKLKLTYRCSFRQAVRLTPPKPSEDHAIASKRCVRLRPRSNLLRSRKRKEPFPTSTSVRSIIMPTNAIGDSTGLSTRVYCQVAFRETGADVNLKPALLGSRRAPCG